MTGIPAYEVFAIRYATRDGLRREQFMMPEKSDASMPLDYFIWVAVSETSVLVIDGGVTAEVASTRVMNHLRDPADALALIGLSPDRVTDVIVTHMHYDHTGTFSRFGGARFHIQEPEMRFVVGPYISRNLFRHGYTLDDIVFLVEANFNGRVSQYDGHAEIVPGVEVYPVEGHSIALQVVRIHTARGWITIASDAMHYYENMTEDRPFYFTIDVVGQLRTFSQLRRIGGNLDSIIPGHDPLVMQYYPSPSPELEGIVARLDVPPTMPGSGAGAASAA